MAQASNRGQGEIQAQKQLSDPGCWCIFLLLQGLATSTLAAVEASDENQACKCLHSIGGRLQDLGLEFCTHVAEGLAGCWCRSLALFGGGRWSKEVGRTRVAGVCTHESLWVKTSEICMGLLEAVLAFGFFRGESCWGLLQSRWLGTMVTPTCVADTGSPCLPSLCLVISLYLGFADLWVGKNRSGSFVQVPKRQRTLVTHPTVPFSLKKTLPSWGGPSWH